MKESKEDVNSEFYKICSICNKRNLDLKENNLIFLNQNRKLKDNLHGIKSSELIKKCYCKNTNASYVHRYCILLKIIYNFEIKCDKCNTFYNIKINKTIDVFKKTYLYVIFFFIYIIHLIIYIICMLLLFINSIYKKNAINIKYYHIPIFFGCILFLINTIVLYFSIVNNIHYYKYMFKYKLNIFTISNNINNHKKDFYELIYDYYKWFYDKSKTKLLINKHKNYLLNNINNNHEILKKYINDNNNYIYLVSKKEKGNKKIEENISKINYDYSYSNNYLNLNSVCKNESENPIDIMKKNKNKNNNMKEKEPENNNFLDDLYSDKTNNNDEENNIYSNKLINQSNIIDVGNINNNSNNNNNKKDYINININQIQGNNINININFNNDKKNNLLNNSSNNHENNEFNFRASKLNSENTGKTALIPNKNLMNKIMDDNNYKMIKKRKQIKSIKLKQKDIQIKDTKIIGNIEENEEVDFSEFEKGKLDSKISKMSKEKLHLIINTGVGNDLFRTKKSYKDVPLNISNPTESVIYDDIPNRASLKNKNNKISNCNNTNIFQYNKK